jgi:hypothetical protein
MPAPPPHRRTNNRGWYHRSGELRMRAAPTKKKWRNLKVIECPPIALAATRKTRAKKSAHPAERVALLLLFSYLLDFGLEKQRAAKNPGIQKTLMVTNRCATCMCNNSRFGHIDSAERVRHRRRGDRISAACLQLALGVFSLRCTKFRRDRKYRENRLTPGPDRLRGL